MDGVKQIVVFKLGDVQYGFPIEQISEIISFVEPLEIPEVPGYMEGLISLREKVYAMINLRNFLGMGKKPADDNSKIIIAAAGKVGFIVDEINMIVTPREEEIDISVDLPVFVDKDNLLYILKIDGEIIIVLNMLNIVNMSIKDEKAVCSQRTVVK